jgi:predicted ATP-dependent endonuclease of OLD family
MDITNYSWWYETLNKVILLDEPETHLHPSGQKYLRNELLKISENNLVIYATHSIAATFS